MVRFVDFVTAIIVFAVHLRQVFIFRPFPDGSRELGGLPIRFPRGREPMDSAAVAKKSARNAGNQENQEMQENPGIQEI